MDKNVTSGKRPVVMLANAGHKPLDTRIFHKEARSLQQVGHKVTLIIPHREDFIKEGVQIISVSLPVKGWEQLVKCPWKIFLKARQQPRNAVFHLHDSELLLVGLALKFSGRKVIYDAHEDTPLQISYQHWIPTLVKPFYSVFYRLLEKLAGWWFDAVIVAEPVIAKYFLTRKTLLIRNFPIASSFQKEISLAESQFDLAYVGLLSEARGIVEMLEAHKMASAKKFMSFVLGGKFAPATLERELLPKYNVEYRAWLSYEEMVATLYNSKAGIIIPHPIERYKTNYPVKLFEYMAAGLPVIASKEGESAEFVREGEAGILVDPLRADEIAAAMLTLSEKPDLAAEMGKRGRKLILEKYNWENESQRLINLYKNI